MKTDQPMTPPQTPEEPRTMWAYHSDPNLKAQMLAAMAEHAKADRIIAGIYVETGKAGEFIGGCAVGCALESVRQIRGLPKIEHGNHALYERFLGVPRMLARLEDGIFEGLSGEAQLSWPSRFLAAIRPGADLSMAWPRFALNLLTDPERAVVKRADKSERVRAAVEQVAALYQRWVDGDKPSDSEWKSARSIADAAAYAADADAAAAAAAAYAAAAADADAAASADAAAAYAACAAARQSERRRQADVLIQILEAL